MWDYVMFWLAKDIKDLLMFLGVCGAVGVGYLVLLAVAKISNKKRREINVNSNKKGRAED